MTQREQIIEALSNRAVDVKSTDGDYAVTFVGRSNRKEFTIDIPDDADVIEIVRKVSTGMSGASEPQDSEAVKP